jgi:hypothetical protein
MRTSLPGDCAGAASGQAATPPISVMNARRFTASPLSCFQSTRIARLRLAGETAALRGFRLGHVCCGQKQTWSIRGSMSALPPATEMDQRDANVSFARIGHSAIRSKKGVPTIGPFCVARGWPRCYPLRAPPSLGCPARARKAGTLASEPGMRHSSAT